MTAIANSSCKAAAHKLIVLDYQYHDVTELLLELLERAKAGQLSGLVVAASLERGHGEPYLFASSGRLAVNQAEAVGAAVLLQNKLVTEG